MNDIQTSSTSHPPLPRHWIEKMFDKMLLDYGKKFIDQWAGTDPEKLISHWAQELAGFTNDELKRGYNALAERDWPPTLPEFKKMCRGSVDPLIAYYEAVAGMQARSKGEIGEWSHPAIYWAAVPLSYDLLSQTFSQIKTRWEAALRDQLALGEWGAIPVPVLALPAPGKGKADREQASKVLAEIGAKTVIKTPSSNHRRWIDKVFDRQNAKDSSLPGISVMFAKEAMKAKAE